MTTDRRPALYSAFEHAADIVAGIETSQLRDPTPCPSFDVAALVDHIVGAANRAAALGHGADPRGQEFPHVALGDAPGEIRKAAEHAQAGWSDDTRLVSTVTMPWGEIYTGNTLVDMYLAELATHTWDLAAATNQLARLDPALPTPSLQAARAMLKPEYRNMMGKGSPFGSEVDAPADALPWNSLVAFMGRDPQSHSAST